MIPAYHVLVHDIVDLGDEVSCRGFKTRELRGVQVKFNAGDLVLRPRTNVALGYMELMQLLAGVFEPEAIRRVAPKADHSLFTPQMAYGPRIRDQIVPVVEALRHDETTRQAVLFVGDASDGPTSGQTCTSTIQFLIRRDASGYPHLETYVAMRSWDLVKGLTYDAVMFGGLALAVERLVGVVASTVTVTAGSAHVYESDLDKLPTGPLDHGTFMFRTLSDSVIDGLHWMVTSNAHAAVGQLSRWALSQVRDASWVKGPPTGVAEYRRGPL